MQDLLKQLAAGGTLSVEQATAAFETIMSGQADPAQVGALLAMIQLRGPTVDELTGAAKVMRAKVLRVEAPPGLTLIDTCGTGGDASDTFNISTAAALVVAAAGRPRNVAVAKHGNRAVTSKSGSSQVLEALGVQVSCDARTLVRCLDDIGLCFCFAPLHHPAMKYAAPIRQALGFRTIFNLLGPLTNPAGANRQLIGVFSAALTAPVAAVLQRLGAVEAMVVHGSLCPNNSNGSGFDELSTVGVSQVSHLRDGQVRSYEVDAASLDLPKADPATFRVDSPQASAAVIRDVLSGVKGPARDIVCLNAGAALMIAGAARDLAEGLASAQQAIDSGAARKTLDGLVKLSRSQTT